MKDRIYTGLKDKNGKDIYEGDIIRYNRRGGIMANDNTYTSVIKCGDYNGQEYLYFDDDKSFAINSWNFLYYTFEVIGNIEENSID